MSDKAIADINRQYDAIKPPKEVVAGLRDFSNIFSQNAQSIAGLLEQGIIDIKQYDASWKSLSTTFANLEPKAQALASSFILKDILNETNPELYKMTQGLEGVADQALMVQLATFGMTQELMSYISVASNLKTAQEGTREGGLGVLAKAEMAFAGATELSKKQIREKAKAMATLAKEYKKYIDLQNQEEKFSLKKYLAKQILEIENQAKAFTKLAKAKVDANIISNIMGNPEAIAVLAKAEGAALTGYIEQLKNLYDVSEKLKSLQDAYKPQDEILKEQLERAKNVIDFEKFQYDLQFDKELKLGELQASRNDYAIAQIQEQEKLIEESYNKQFESLDKLSRKQEEFNQLQQGKFSLAQALATGDMSGAASAIQSIRDQEAKAQLDRRRQLLEDRKKEELASIRIGGKTKEELEKKIK